MGRLAGSWKAEMNSLRSDNISAVSPKPQPGSKDPFVRNVLHDPSPASPRRGLLNQLQFIGR